jgi:hypothetical protein
LPPVEERERRIGKNEAVFREVNERIERFAESQAGDEELEILCECRDESCAERIELTLPEYERVRQDSRLFFIRRGHGVPEVEEVVEENDNYEVVRKREGPAADVARERDPRDD